MSWNGISVWAAWMVGSLPLNLLEYPSIGCHSAWHVPAQKRLHRHGRPMSCWLLTIISRCADGGAHGRHVLPFILHLGERSPWTRALPVDQATSGLSQMTRWTLIKAERGEQGYSKMAKLEVRPIKHGQRGHGAGAGYKILFYYWTRLSLKRKCTCKKRCLIALLHCYVQISVIKCDASANFTSSARWANTQLYVLLGVLLSFCVVGAGV